MNALCRNLAIMQANEATPPCYTKVYFGTLYDECITVENYLEGEFQKYINNTGDVFGDSALSMKAEAFSHFTYQKSGSNSCLWTFNALAINFLIQKLQPPPQWMTTCLSFSAAAIFPQRQSQSLGLSLLEDQAGVIHAISPIGMKLCQIEGTTKQLLKTKWAGSAKICFENLLLYFLGFFIIIGCTIFKLN